MRVSSTSNFSILYRAVSKEEFTDIKVNGFRNDPSGKGYATCKLFATKKVDAIKFGINNAFFDQKKYIIVQAILPRNLLKKSEHFLADGMKAIAIPENELKKVNFLRK